MSITDELREHVKAFNRLAREGIEDIADRIDAEHERETREQYTKGHNDGFDEGYASADDWYVSHTTELLKHGWIPLPKDADFKAIDVGDKLTDGKNTYTVTSIAFNSCNVVVYGCTEANKSEWPIDQTSKMHHVEHVTVEGTLRELVHEVTPDVEWEDELFAEYAERIREAITHEENK